MARAMGHGHGHGDIIDMSWLLTTLCVCAMQIFALPFVQKFSNAPNL